MSKKVSGFAAKGHVTNVTVLDGSRYSTLAIGRIPA
jgi:hypothetical protein